ncbi:MAG: N-6 DNA methylase [Desulfobaccales bacterium]|jgi:type I restriction-modification system DNA methylase subunit
MKHKDSENRTRTYVTDTLKEIGWNIKKPQKGGNLLQGGEAQKYDFRIKEALEKASKTGSGQGFVDFILVDDNQNPCAIIETKPDKTDIDEAVRDAKHYSKFLNEIGGLDIRIIIGVAGNEESGVAIINYYRNKDKYEIIVSHGQPLTQILNPEECGDVLKRSASSLDIHIPSLEYLYKRADKINKILHKHKVEEASRAKVLASIILAMYQKGDFSLNPKFVIQDINTRVREALQECNNIEQLFSMLILNKHDKSLSNAIPLIVYELKKANINSLMKSGYDILGTFYEVFLKYGGDNKQLGIIFTPRHVTDFACELIEININDKVYDPTCGTGGFLIAAFNKYRTLVNNNKSAIKKLGDTQIYGNDTSASAYPLGVVNMIFRGDGKNNISFDNCFEYPEEKQFTKVLMNPPFQTDADDPPETDFIDHALSCLCVGGRLLSVLPISVLCEPQHKKWRKHIILNHTVEAVFSLPEEAFYPVGTITCLILIKAHIAQGENKIFFCKITDDGFIKKKSKRIKVREGQFKKAIEHFLNKKDEPVFSCYKKLSSPADDENIEILPEAYLDDRRYSQKEIQKNIEAMVKELVIFKIRYNQYMKNEV